MCVCVSHRAGLSFGLYVSFTFKPELKLDDLATKIHSNTQMKLKGKIMTTVSVLDISIVYHIPTVSNWPIFNSLVSSCSLGGFQ